MSEITPTDSNRSYAQTKESYDKKKQELKDKYEDELASLRDSYERKIQETEKSGEAAINHIQSKIKVRTDDASRESQQREKELDEIMVAKKESLARREANQETYVTEARKQKDEWAKNQYKDLAKQKAELEDQAENQIKEVGERNNRRIRQVERKLAGTEEEIQDRGHERIKELKNENEKRIQTLDQQENEKYLNAKKVHQKQMTETNKIFKDSYNKEEEQHTKALTGLIKQRENEREDIKEKSRNDIDQERTKADRRYRETVEANRRRLLREREQNSRAEETVRKEHLSEIDKLDHDTKEEMKQEKERSESDIRFQKDQYKQMTKELEERQQNQRNKQIQLQQDDLSNLEKGHEQRIQNQQTAFETKFARNEELAEHTYTDQAVSLSRELTNQKKKFLQSADKYNGKDKDPFYQIRDNKTKFYETSDAYILKAHVPEHEKNNVEVRVKNDKVILNGHRSFNEEIVEDDRHVKTNNVQTYHEQFDVPKKIREDLIAKEYDHGVLTVKIPKVT